MSFNRIVAQQPVSVHITEKDGLPDIEFYDVLEDHKGFIWLASDSGLYRYDGKTYTQYTNEEKRGLSVFELFEDTLGRIWCTNISGQFFYIENNRLKTFIDLKSELKGQLASFSFHKNHLLITTSSVVYTVHLKTKAITKLPTSTDGGFSNILPYKNKLALVSFKQITLLNTDLQKVQQFKNNNKQGRFTSQGKTFFLKLNNNFFIGQELKKKYLFKMVNLETGKLTATTGLDILKDKRIINTEILDTNLWVLTYTGVYVFENYNNNFKLKKQILKDEIVTKIIVDKDKNYWVTTLTNGIYLIPNIAVVNYTLPSKDNDITAIDKVNDSVILFGTKNGKAGFLNLNQNTLRTTISLKTKVSNLLYNAHKEYSYVSTDNGSFFIDNKSLKTTSINSFQGVKSFSRINDNNILFGTYNRMSFYEETSKLFKKYSNSKRVYTTYYSNKNNTIYVAYVDGLVALDTRLKSVKILYEGKEISVISIAETIDGTIWVGTFKDGVLAIQDNKVVGQYSVKHGLLSNQTKYLKADKNALWIATSKGLQVLDTKTKIFKNLTKTDGVLSYKITGLEILKNKVVLSSNKGIFSFDKSKVFKTFSEPEIYFNAIKVNEKPVVIGSDYQLDYNQNSIDFSFNVNGILYNQNKTYQYRLLGYNANWITTDLGVNNVKYNSLPAGNYIFEVKPVDKNIIKNIKLTIKLPFWKRWWFILINSILLFGFIVLYYRWKLTRKEKAKQLEIKQLFLDKELTALKLENLRSQMNPHFVFNALNSIQEYIISNQKELAGDYLGKFADLIRTYLEHSSKGKISLEEEVTTLNMYLELEKLRFEDTLEFSIKVADNLEKEAINIPTMLIQPYVENALKHGLFHKKENRQLFISISRLSENLIQCVVEDNGVGREKSKRINKRKARPYQSFGVKATTKRLDLLNFEQENKIGVTTLDLFDKSTAIGTRVVLTIPIFKNK